MTRPRQHSRGSYTYILVFLVILILSFSLHYYEILSFIARPSTKLFKRNKSVNDGKLIDLKNFRFTINPRRLCNHCDDKFLLVITIISTPKNRDKRDAIRYLWGKVTKCTKVVFLIGSSSDQVNVHILSESRKNGDIIQGNFRDNSHSLSYKHVMFFKWASNYCEKAKFVVKLDEGFILYLLENDVVLDLAKMRLFMRSVMDDGIACKVLRNGTYFKQMTNLTTILNPETHLPYCWGGLVIYSAKTVHRLLQESYKQPYLNADDIYVTGILAKRIGVKHFNFEPHSILKPREDQWMIQLKQLYDMKISVQDFFERNY